MSFATCPTCGYTDVTSWGVCVHCGTPFENEVNLMKVFVVGRHNVDLGDQASQFEIVGSESPTFGPTATEAETQLEDLFSKAKDLSADALLLQNTPGVLTAALLKEQIKAGGQLPFKVGVIISVQGERPANVSKDFPFMSEPDTEWGAKLGGFAAEKAKEAVSFANGRATAVVNDSTLTVTVDPVAPFLFSHIEWL